jgi:DNA-binding transcriptional ArsR family regulator
MSDEVAGCLEALFKVLGNRTRLKMLHAIVREGEISVGHLAETVNMKPQAVSNQLQRLLDKGILTARRSGNNISYQILDACVVALLDYGLCILEASGELESQSTVYAGDP